MTVATFTTIVMQILKELLKLCKKKEKKKNEFGVFPPTSLEK